MHLFYHPESCATDEEFILHEEESQHLTRVLRLTVGDHIQVLNGKGGLATCSILETGKKCRLRVLEFSSETEPDYQIHIAVAPTKQLERMEWFVEKATEIGITEISFIHSKNAERPRINLDRLVKKSISALKQSRRRYLPVINDLQAFDSFVTAHPSGLIAHCYAGEKTDLGRTIRPTACPILIGPEGDFTQTEVALAMRLGYHSITLGENRLRTETAALFACTAAKLTFT